MDGLNHNLLVFSPLQPTEARCNAECNAVLQRGATECNARPLINNDYLSALQSVAARCIVQVRPLQRCIPLKKGCDMQRTEQRNVKR